MSYVSELKQRVVEAEQKAALLESMLDSFWTGDVPQNATPYHYILAKAGRQRLAEKAKTAALLTSPTTN